MACKHSAHDDPSRCSQCLGVVATHIEICGSSLLIDGAPAGRPIEPGGPQYNATRARRGGVASGRRTYSRGKK